MTALYYLCLSGLLLFVGHLWGKHTRFKEMDQEIEHHKTEARFWRERSQHLAIEVAKLKKGNV